MIDEELKIFEVNLAVSNICNADCLFCPRSFVKVAPADRFMSVESVRKIMQEVSTSEFREDHPVVHSVLSENGEPFMNPHILDILREVRKVGLYITLFSNFALITKDIAKILIDENLVDNLDVNIDGLIDETYRAVKGISLDRVEENLRRFIELRNSSCSSIRVRIHCISHYTYTKAVNMAFGIGPVKGKGYTYLQDGPSVVEKWKRVVNPALDGVGEDSVMFWAERYNDKKREGVFACPNLGRVQHVAYINPKGDWYACCFDTGNDLVVGNVLETSILEVSKSERRKDLIAKLGARKFGEIGFPCTRVDACSGVERGGIV